MTAVVKIDLHHVVMTEVLDIAHNAVT